MNIAKPKHAWMVRARNDNELADLVEEKNAVAIGWPEMVIVSCMSDDRRETTMSQTITHITTSGGLISDAFIENIHKPGARQREGDPALPLWPT